MFLYSSVSSPFDCSKRFTLLPPPPWQTCSFRHQLDFSGSILVMQQLGEKTIHSHFHHCQVLIYTAERTEVSWRQWKCPNFKITLFRTFCCNLYTCQLWWNFTQAAMRKINVAYNNAFRMIMQLPRYCSASNMFAMCNVPSCQAVMRNLVYRFTIRVDRSENKLLCAIGNSDMRYQSRIKKHWMSSLYVHFRAWILLLFVFLLSFFTLDLCIVHS